MHKLLTTLFLASALFAVKAQTKAPNPRPLTMDEYKKALTYTIADLDKDSYVKFDNAYVLDRYESRKPYFITGIDGLKKRIDLYKLVAKDGMQEIGTMIFYTNEKGKVYQALLPDFTADAIVWRQYFDDIDHIDKEEKNFVLKLSYVISKEFSFQQYKVMNGGKDMKEEAGTYGNDICFPGDDQVTMASGIKKSLKDIKPGDQVISIDPATEKELVVEVKELTTHDAKNYAITKLTLVSATIIESANGHEVALTAKLLQATPNHPMMTKNGNRKMGEINEGEQVLCFNEKTGKYEPYIVLKKTESAGGIQKVYNIVADGGSTLMMNGVMVLQK